MRTASIYGPDGGLVYEGILEEILINIPIISPPVPDAWLRAEIDRDIRAIRERLIRGDRRAEPRTFYTSHALEQRGIQVGNFGGILRSEHRMRVRGPLSEEVWKKRRLQLGLESGYGLFYMELTRWEIHDRGYRSYWET